MLIGDFQQFGGRQTETCSIRNSLNHLGIKAPHSREPYSEPLLFGLGGGIGFSYFLFERAGSHPIHINTRIHTQETEQPEFFQKIAGRIGVPLEVQNSSSATAAAVNLKRRLERGTPPIVTVDAQKLPYLGLTSPLYTYYALVVYGIDEENGHVHVSDRCPAPLTIGKDELRASRSSSWSPKYRSVTLSQPDGEPDIVAALTEAIRETARQLQGGVGVANFGLKGLEKWATVLTSNKEKKSWPKVFASGPALYQALFSIFAQISTRCDTGHAHRLFYAEFLDEAAEILGRPELRTAAELYRNADREWAEVADAHLPSSIPVFAEAKDLAFRRRKLFETKGPGANGEITKIRDRLAECEKEAGENFPLSFQDSRVLFNDLRQRILKLRDVEAEAAKVLESAVS